MEWAEDEGHRNSHHGFYTKLSKEKSSRVNIGLWSKIFGLIESSNARNMVKQMGTTTWNID